MNIPQRAAILLSLPVFLCGILGGADQPAPKPVDRSDAYYNYAMGHLYGELAAAYGNRGEYVSRAIDFYKEAIKADPSATMLNDELAGLYFQAGRGNEAIAELQDRLKKDPKALDARRLLGRIYLVQIGRQDRNRGVDEEMVKLAIEQYRTIVEQDPKDIDSWLLLGRLYKVAQNSLESEKSFQKVLQLEPGNEEAMTGLAMVYSGLGDNQRALEILKQVADRNPSPRTLTALVDAYETLHDYAGAAEVLRRASELDPSNPDLKRNLAQDLVLAGKPEESLKVYADLVQDDPRDTESFLGMSQVYRQMNDFAKARAALDRAKQLEPDNFEIRYSEVSLLEAEGRHADAISAMKQLVDSTESKSYSPPERANRLRLLEALGDLYRSNEQFALAVETFRKMPELDPDTGARASRQIVGTYREAKDYTHALAEAEAAFKKYADDRGVGLTRASLLAEMGKGEQAAAEVKRLYAGDGGKDSGFALAEIYEKSKNYQEMGRALDVVEKLSPTQSEKVNLCFMRGAMYERSKQWDLAEKEFRKALEIEPDNVAVLNYFGYMLADRDVRLDEAHKMIGRAIEQDPQNGAYLDSLGWVYYRMGKFAEAEAALRQAIARVSRDATVHDHLGDVLARQGKLKEAVAEWEISLKEYDANSPSEKDPVEVAKITKKVEGARVRLAQQSGARRTP